MLKTIFNNKMYVCLCEAVTEQEVRCAVEAGACSVAEVMGCTGAGTRCGTCRSELAEIVASTAPARRRLDVLNARPAAPSRQAA